MSSTYLPWAKLRSHARFNLATSGVAHWKLRDLPVGVEQLEISGPSFYGYEPLQRALASHAGVTPERIVAAGGTSMANYLAIASLVKAGDEVLIELPTYEAILAVLRYVGADVRRVERRAEDGFALDPAAVRRAVTPKTKLIVVANLHNPSSALTSEAVIQEIGAIGPRVLVDEVYLDVVYEKAPKSAALLGDQFVVTSSLTKAYGLSGLRCGWIVAEPRLAERMWRLNDLFGVIPAHMAELVSVIAIGELARIRDSVRARLDRNRAILNRFLDSRDDLQVCRQPFGTVVFPRVINGADLLCSILREKYETTVVPGEHFEMREHIRIGIGGDAEPLEEGLRRLGLALDELKEKR